MSRDGCAQVNEEMEPHREQRVDNAVLIVVADPARRAGLEQACRAAGVRARGAGSVAELERWPDGEMVITDAAYVTPLWHEFGAADVIALVENAEQGVAALGRGASKWLQHGSSVVDIAASARSQTLDTSEVPHFNSESHPTADVHVSTDAEYLKALDEFFPEEGPAEEEKPFRAISIPPVEQHASTTVLLRPAKDRRSARRRHRALPSRRALAGVALTAVLGTAAYFLSSIDVAPARSPGGTTTPVEPGSADVPPPEHAGGTAPVPGAGATVQSLESPAESVGAVPSREAFQDLTGSWAMTNQIQTSRYRPYQGLRIGFRLRLRHEGTRITGEGQKWLENGRAVPRANRTPITVSGVVEGRRIVLTFSEGGRRRQSQGRFDLELTAGGALRGTFESDAARSRGSSVAQRVRIDEVAANKPR
jgi:hypothetical protein